MDEDNDRLLTWRLVTYAIEPAGCLLTQPPVGLIRAAAQSRRARARHRGLRVPVGMFAAGCST
jgi:hypothetical protein